MKIVNLLKAVFLLISMIINYNINISNNIYVFIFIYLDIYVFIHIKQILISEIFTRKFVLNSANM